MKTEKLQPLSRKRKNHRIVVAMAVVVLMLSATPVLAQSYFMAVDIPTKLNAAPSDFLSHQIVERVDGVYLSPDEILEGSFIGG